MRLHSWIVAALVVVGPAVLSGCYGSTEPPTNITPVAATFNGQGTANDGPAHVYFEYWPTSAPALVQKTSGHDVQGNKTGAVSDTPLPTVRLQPATGYSFRLCATDRGVPDGACAQTRTFNTARPTGDYLDGLALSNNVLFRIHAESQAGGSGPSGGMTITALTGGTGVHIMFEGNVTCLSVHGSDAVVGAVAETPGQDFDAVVASVHDTGVSGNADAVAYESSTSPPDCSHGPSPTSQGTTGFAVYDSP